MRSSPEPPTLTALQPVAKTAQMASNEDEAKTLGNGYIEGKTYKTANQFTGRAGTRILARDRPERHNRSPGRRAWASRV
jgi:hypothetical protein